MLTATAGALLPASADAAVFAAAVLALNATPGVDVLLTVSRTLAGGARAGAAAALGISAGCVVHALAAAFGLAALLALYPQALAAVQWAGAAYLAWLGVKLLRQAAAPAAGADTHPTPATPDRLGGANPGAVALATDFRTGLLTNVLNPKVALFFLAFLPQFVPAASPHPTASFLLLGAWFVAQSMVFLALLIAVAAALARRARARPRPALQRVLSAVGGLAFVALALRLVTDTAPAPTAR